MPPSELAGRAGIVAITFPWGSLLRGTLGHDDAVTAGIATLLAPAGELEILVSLEPRDGGPTTQIDETVIAAAAEAWQAFGIELMEAAPATRSDLAASHSSWARRLGTDPDRRAWRVRGVRRAGRPNR
jgi:16S rRNA (adenine(1408)-N(1))-methyltransferase